MFSESKIFLGFLEIFGALSQINYMLLLRQQACVITDECGQKMAILELIVAKSCIINHKKVGLHTS